MKRNLLITAIALSLPALATASTSDNLNYELFGKFNAAHKAIHNNSNGDDSYARVGVKASTSVNSDITAFGLVEAQYSNGKDEQNVFARYGYAGLQYGDDIKLSYGRQDGVVKIVRDVTDILPQSGGDALVVGDGAWFNGITDNLVSLSVDNLLVPDLTLTAQYLAKDETSEDRYKQHGEGLGLALQYQLGFASLNAAYTVGSQAEDLSHEFSRKPHAETFAFSTGFDLAPVFVGLLYAESRDVAFVSGGEYVGQQNLAGKLQSFEAVATYTTDWGLKPAIGYNVAYASDLYGSTTREKATIVDEFSFGASYALTDNVEVSGAFVYNRLKDNDKAVNKAFGLNTDDYVKVGVSYTF